MEPGPGGQPAGGFKAGHVRPGFGDDDVGDNDGYPGNGGKEFPGGAKGFHRLIGPRGEFIDPLGARQLRPRGISEPVRYEKIKTRFRDTRGSPEAAADNQS